VQLVGYLRRTPDAPADQTIVIVVYGLYDSASSRYMGIVTDALVEQGFTVFVPEMRWHGCLLATAPQALSTLGIREGQDLSAWASYLEHRFHGAAIGLLGFSLGALDVIHALTQNNARELFAAGGIAISPPALLTETVAKFDRPTSFRANGLRNVVAIFFRSNLARRERDRPDRHDRGPFTAYLEHLREAEPSFQGWSTAAVLAAAAPESKLPSIQRPLLILASIDDPVFAPGASRSLRDAAVNSDYVHVIETPFGGHIGHFVDAPKWFATQIRSFFATSPRCP
jgi:predicted alpha/beta-fold hydrolase